MNIAPATTALEVMNRLLTGIRNDAAFNAFCLSELGAYPTQYLGFDPNNPPKGDKIPWLGTVLTGSQVSDDYGAYLYNISIGCAISASTSTTTDAVTGVISYDSVDLSDECSRLLYAAAMESVMRTNTNLETDILDISPIQINTNLPHVAMYFDMTIAVELSMTQ